MNETVTEPVGPDNDHSGPKKYSVEWFDTPEGIADCRRDMLHVMVATLRNPKLADHIEDARHRLHSGDWHMGGIDTFLIAIEDLREELIAWAEREYALAQHERQQA